MKQYYALSTQSMKLLEEVHPDLRAVIQKVSLIFPIEVICGFRDQEDQDRAYFAGHSKVKWPDSKHNQFPSRAVDIQPVPYIHAGAKEFAHLAGHVLGVAYMMNVCLRWGGDWDSDLDQEDQTFRDLYHFELL